MTENGGPEPGRLGLSTKFGLVGERDFGCLWGARTISHLGDYAFRIAFATYIISETRSPNVLAVSTAVLVVPSLVFYLVGGAVSDRVTSRRAVMVIADLARFVITALLALGVATSDSIPLLVGLALLISIGEGFFRPASFAFMKDIVPRKRLMSANSSMSISQQIGIIGGPLLGGALVGLAGPALAFAFDAVTFLISGVLILLISRQSDARASDADGVPESSTDPARGVRGVLADVKAGLKYIRGQGWLLVSLSVGPGANALFAGVLAVTIPLIMAPNGSPDAGFLGWYYAMQAVGALTGAVLLGRLTFTRLGRSLFIILGLMGVSLAVVGVLGKTPVTFAMAFTYGLGLHIFNTLYRTLLHEKVPDSMTGRVSSVSDLAFNGAMPLGQIVIGPLAVAFTAEGATLGAGAVAALVCFTAALAPGIRALRLDTSGVEPEERGEAPLGSGAKPDTAPATVKDPDSRLR
ncbi:MFS transporter [Streptomyces griseus]|uniref:MFS transporter n=1 Tax=Streptomyces griseus TaxID=1911 RepID=UPI00067A8ECA|nr:MFS transporter [Streptomyces griseus]